MPGPPDAGEDFTVSLRLSGPVDPARFQQFKAALNQLVANYQEAKITEISVTPSPNP